MAVKIQVKIFWVVTAVYSFHSWVPPFWKMKAARPCKTMVFYYSTTWHHNPEDLDLSLVVVYPVSYLVACFKLSFHITRGKQWSCCRCNSA